jgi:hypothetical protein
MEHSPLGRPHTVLYDRQVGGDVGYAIGTFEVRQCGEGESEVVLEPERQGRILLDSIVVWAELIPVDVLLESDGDQNKRGPNRLLACWHFLPFQEA